MENFLFDAIARLSKAKVEFVICGGVACILQGSIGMLEEILHGNKI